MDGRPDPEQILKKNFPKGSESGHGRLKIFFGYAAGVGLSLIHIYIQNQVWGYDTTDDYQSLRVFMANIRRKIEDDTANPRFILTEVGVGYRFADE